MGLPPVLNDKEIRDLPRDAVRCVNCGHATYQRVDGYHGERICQKCGYVQSMKAKKTIEDLEARTPPKPGHDLDPTEYEFLSNDKKWARILQLERTYNTKTGNKEDWRYKSLYKPYVKVVETEFGVNKYHRRWLYRCLDRLPLFGGLDALSRNCSYQEIITSLRIRLMRRDKQRFSINTNKFCKSIKLNDRKYNIIIENLEILQEKGLMNKDKITESGLEKDGKIENLQKEIEMINALHELKGKKGRRGPNT